MKLVACCFQITERERKTAEMAYIKSYSDSYYSSHRENTFGLFIHDHPRYQQLANGTSKGLVRKWPLKAYLPDEMNFQ